MKEKPSKRMERIRSGAEEYLCEAYSCFLYDPTDAKALQHLKDAASHLYDVQREYEGMKF